MATQKTRLRLDILEDRHKKKALKALSTLSGIESIVFDTREQSMTIIGFVDPVDIVNKLRKYWLVAQIVSVGPAKEDKKDVKKDDKKNVFYPYPSRTPEAFTLEYLCRITNNFSEERIISRGGYGVVYKGIREVGRTYIAVMKLHLTAGLDGEELKKKFNKLMMVQHPNTIHLIGYCHHIAQVRVKHNGEYVSARVDERALCYEFLPGGSLDKHLSNKPCELDWDKCWGIITGLCEGLFYLYHAFQHPIYHLDLKPSEIFLDRDMNPKIGGFGLSRLFDSIETNNTSEVTETSVYMPPEYINRREISSKFDVFSLGVIIIQVMAGSENYSKCTNIPHEEFVELVKDYWVKKISPTLWKHKSSYDVIACIEIALKCVQSDQAMRPTITEIVERLRRTYIADGLHEFHRTRKFTLQFLERITNNFSEENIIGRGGYGTIYKGTLDSGEEMAVKKLKSIIWTNDEQFKNELSNLMNAQHRNIVRLTGYCHHTEHVVVEYKGKLVSASVEERALCMEYLQGGNLDMQLSDRACRLDWDKCFNIIKGICDGLNYLHNESGHQIYHLDLKPANILLDKDMIPKIGDFGLSRLCDSTQTHMTQSQFGTSGFLPPEYINGQKISPKFDVYSLGVVIIQMMAGKNGYYDSAETPPREFIELVHGNWRKRLQATTMSYYASQEVRTCIEIALRCVEPDRVRRPTIAEIINELSNIGTAKSAPIGQVYILTPRISR